MLFSAAMKSSRHCARRCGWSAAASCSGVAPGPWPRRPHRAGRRAPGRRAATGRSCAAGSHRPAPAARPPGGEGKRSRWILPRRPRHTGRSLSCLRAGCFKQRFDLSHGDHGGRILTLHLRVDATNARSANTILSTYQVGEGQRFGKVIQAGYDGGGVAVEEDLYRKQIVPLRQLSHTPQQRSQAAGKQPILGFFVRNQVPLNAAWSAAPAVAMFHLKAHVAGSAGHRRTSLPLRAHRCWS